MAVGVKLSNALFALRARGVAMDSSVAKPPCAASRRGKFWFTPAGAGAADTLEVCARDGAGAYA